MAKKQNEISYTQAMEKLQSIVEEIQDETIDVDELSTKVKKATELISMCKEKIQKTELEVETILNKFQKAKENEPEKD